MYKFSPGDWITYRPLSGYTAPQLVVGNQYLLDHVVISSYEMFVILKYIDGRFSHTHFTTNRQL